MLLLPYTFTRTEQNERRRTFLAGRRTAFRMRFGRTGLQTSRYIDDLSAPKV
jgi:hypothetical protein